MKLVSICIPTYNGEKYLREALYSVKTQTYQNIEVIISDDNSTDNTLEICEEFKKNAPFPVYIYSHHPEGIGSNWNHCIEKSHGEFIKMFFQDDILKPTCVEVMMKTLLENNLDCVVSKREIIDEHSQKVTDGNWYTKFNDLQKTAGLPVDRFITISKHNLKELNFKVYSTDNIIGEPCVSLFSRELYSKIGPFSTELQQILDYEYWLRVLRKFNIGIINEKLVSFRYHPLQTSTRNYENGIREGKIIIDFLEHKMFWYLPRKHRGYFLRKKYPIYQKLADLKNKLIGR